MSGNLVAAHRRVSDNVIEGMGVSARKRTVQIPGDWAAITPGTPTDPGPRSTGRMLTDARTMVDPALRAAVATLPAAIAQITAYHFGWRDRTGIPLAPVDGGWGKAVRSALVLSCAGAVGGHTADAIPAAVAVELVHNASLLHDDIIDGDFQRRHRPAVWAAFGKPAAILAGDALFFLSITMLADGPATPTLEAITRLSGSDLRKRKKTLPVITTLASGTPAGRQLAALYDSDTPLSDNDVDRAATLVQLAGGCEPVQILAEQHLREATDILRTVHPTHTAKADLTALIQLITQRDH
jgi:geranylgeranyl pyrophosphate synthase